MSDEASPRPWREDNYCIYDANGKIVAGISSTTDNEDALLIVAAVNERDRLRDLVRRLADSLQGIIDAADGKGEGVLDEALLREARAAIGEEVQ